MFFILSIVIANPAMAKNVELTLSDLFGASHSIGKLIAEWGKEVEKRTEGRVKMIYFPAQSLTKATKCYDGVVNGLSDMGHGILQYTRGRFPLSDFINLPVGVPSGMVATAVINEYREKFKPAELENVQIMYLHAHGPGLIHTNKKQVKTMADLKGLKIRGHGGPTVGMLKALSATPLGFPMPELYQALQKGVVDGAVYPFEANMGWKLADVTKNVAVCRPIAYSLAFFMAMSKEKWNLIASADQKIIEEINLEWIHKQGRLWDQLDKEGEEFFKKSGGTISRIDAQEAANWKKAVAPVIAEYVKTTTANGLPGDKVIEFVNMRLNDAATGKFKSKYRSAN